MKATIQNFFAKLFGQTSGLYYINGPQTLPPPLSKEEEDALLALLPDEKARQTLVERNLRLVVYIAKRFESSGTGIEDLISIGTIGLMKAVSTFCPNKQIKLATYASRCIENEILMYLRKSAGQRTELSLDEPLNVDYDGNELLLGDMLGTESDDVCKELEKREEKRLIRKALDSLSERERLIIELRFGFCTNGGKEKTQKEVADLLGISQSYISRLEKKIIERLKELLEKEGCS
ncbi:MAG: RNA polymerase sporulation sigma factor SigE [Clostridiales bacterium]|nr:RNA polymerase sporulation sigma factor SigE [Candidatus Coliplasma caballi]